MTDDVLSSLKRQRMLYGPGIHRLVRLSGTLTVQTPLHIGTGAMVPAHQTTDKTDNIKALHREVGSGGKGAPFLPGSSLKGVLRSWCEAMLHPIQGAAPKSTPTEVEQTLDDRIADLRRDSSPEDRSDDQLRAEILRTELDLVSGIFGSTRWRSKVSFHNARVASSHAQRSHERDAQESTTAVLHRVALDPHLGAADDGRLFGVEVVLPKVAFDLELRARNLCDWELGLLLFALEAFNHELFPLRLGGGTQQGYGQLEWEASTCTVLGESGPSSVLSDWMQVLRQGDRRARPTDLDKPRSQFRKAWRALVDGGA